MKCTSCKREITSNEQAVQFPCPSCDEIVIRCERCRVLVNKYQCKCGEFVGP
ncbi:MAG: hypothetical protein AMQ22_01941 [Candidatus Methanofastidiosum methylothiophilum]|uniref:Small zinc finger protein HVO-2753-like zinc-binding pocket domain-containing protein n=1 Tax=Candidatus Methanofastidiosum methylothiophilum TaxID=1705564 RepID=A0A150IN00_9EURY|nr:MAG: hypothetical protein APG10_00343 [Candidatus Methanofastidiosum methylthiophilus]MCC7572176.1 DUF1610 domain-containing protein [Methanofastidiosum sp.]KYC47680.1 MAG: hypothetical protein AMQ22_01941 [Candidatus Methanofastidiosum methylthiophilus]KYC48612.1 MAG: hypothetical protein APG11_00122 [Candidatus Methanofastidiosum methylthiophilus]KYC51183.1 MAG: hypothetical protein APG12_00309 [Candidatus Methanofastidiosum methylthiophilus]